MQQIEIREMHEDDLDRVMEIETSVYPYPWTRGIMRDCLRVNYDCFIATLDEEIIAHAVLSVAAGESHILNLAVDQVHQGQGIGRHFLAHLMDRARIKQADMLLLEVRPSNRAAIELYESSGFNEIGCRKAYYPAPNGKEDALILACQL